MQPERQPHPHAMAGREPAHLGAWAGFPKADFIELISETAIALQPVETATVKLEQKALAECLQRTRICRSG
jgi:hypothetical protein